MKKVMAISFVIGSFIVLIFSGVQFAIFEALIGLLACQALKD